MRKTLQRRAKHIQDDELKRRAVRWIQQSLQVPASTVSDYIDHQLSGDGSRVPDAYDHDRVENGEDAFPDACGAVRTTAGLSDYYVALATEELYRIAESATDGTTFKREIRGLATP